MSQKSHENKMSKIIFVKNQTCCSDDSRSKCWNCCSCPVGEGSEIIVRISPCIYTKSYDQNRYNVHSKSCFRLKRNGPCHFFGYELTRSSSVHNSIFSLGSSVSLTLPSYSIWAIGRKMSKMANARIGNVVG